MPAATPPTTPPTRDAVELVDTEFVVRVAGAAAVSVSGPWDAWGTGVPMSCDTPVTDPTICAPEPATASPPAEAGADDAAGEETGAETLPLATWRARVAVPVGRVAFKFRVADEWFISDEYECEANGLGGRNNWRLVESTRARVKQAVIAQKAVTDYGAAVGATEPAVAADVTDEEEEGEPEAKSEDADIDAEVEAETGVETAVEMGKTEEVPRVLKLTPEKPAVKMCVPETGATVPDAVTVDTPKAAHRPAVRKAAAAHKPFAPRRGAKGRGKERSKYVAQEMDGGCPIC